MVGSGRSDLSAVTCIGAILRDDRTTISCSRGEDGRVRFEFKDRLIPLKAEGHVSEFSGLEPFAEQYLKRLQVSLSQSS